MNIAIVTPWHNHQELLADYMEAVGVAGEWDELIIVDCGSEPQLEFATVYPGSNLGFCGGSNYGLNCATADAVVFLNNDVRIRSQSWLEEIRASLEPGVLVGQLRNGLHTSVDNTLLTYLDGWCLAGMRSELLALGGFDETLEEPAYYSDNLLCLEARAAGMTLVDLRIGLEHLQNVTAGPAWDSRVQAATTSNRARYQARARELLVAS